MSKVPDKSPPSPRLFLMVVIFMEKKKKRGYFTAAAVISLVCSPSPSSSWHVFARSQQGAAIITSTLPRERRSTSGSKEPLLTSQSLRWEHRSAGGMPAWQPIGTPAGPRGQKHLTLTFHSRGRGDLRYGIFAWKWEGYKISERYYRGLSTRKRFRKNPSCQTRPRIKWELDQVNDSSRADTDSGSLRRCTRYTLAHPRVPEVHTDQPVPPLQTQPGESTHNFTYQKFFGALMSTVKKM